MSSLDDAAEQHCIQQSIQRLKIKTSSPELAIGRLSGGNQQKAILARCLLLNPRILILDEPTRGIDIGAKYEIYKLINQLVQQGIAVIVISSELPEVLGLSDRVLVMHEGRLKANLVNQHLTRGTGDGSRAEERTPCRRTRRLKSNSPQPPPRPCRR